MQTLSEPGIEEFWDDLLAFLDDGKVIAVVGPELLTVLDQGREVGLYRALAERLLAKYGLIPANDVDACPTDASVVLRPHQELNDAVCALAQRGKRIQDLYRPINDLLRAILGPQPIIPRPLRELARISAFDLFVATTFDDLLARALDEERGGGTQAAERVVYTPNLSGEQVRDIPELRPSNYCAVFSLFGRASVSQSFVIHEEDTLEFIYSLQTGRGNLPTRMLVELQTRHLLLIGCNFPDWLSRFFIRLSNEVRLSRDDRSKREFLVGHETSCETGLTMFLERFSRNSRVFPGDAASFVGELARRWAERHPAATQAAEAAPDAIRIPAGGGEIFISYSRTDLPAALTLFNELKELGAGVLWFDKSLLKPGVEWNPEIMGAIKRCALFLPLVSSTTEARKEGYFRLEWDEAAKRSRMIQGKKFIFPVVVDAEFDGNQGRYALVPEEFGKFQYGHAPGGRMSEELRRAITEGIRDLERMRKGTA